MPFEMNKYTFHVKLFLHMDKKDTKTIKNLSPSLSTAKILLDI